MRYEFHPDALDEYLGATSYYSNYNASLAMRFVESVEDAIAKITASPSRWRVLDEDVRRCLTRTFPYGILYTIENDFVLIVAVMHCSREPGYWKGRLDSQGAS
jgi:plasmid stabilization system protein ParE